MSSALAVGSNRILMYTVSLDLRSHSFNCKIIKKNEKGTQLKIENVYPLHIEDMKRFLVGKSHYLVCYNSSVLDGFSWIFTAKNPVVLSYEPNQSIGEHKLLKDQLVFTSIVCRVDGIEVTPNFSMPTILPTKNCYSINRDIVIFKSK